MCQIVSTFNCTYQCSMQVLVFACQYCSLCVNLIDQCCLNKCMQGIPGCNPPNNRSCQEILRCFPMAQTGNYQIHLLNGSMVEVFCNMDGTNCGGKGGWTRVAYVNMTKSGATCPPGLVQKTFSGQTLCSRTQTGCTSTMFSTFSLNYCEVCGQIRGYQFGTPEAFARSIIITSLTIDSQYLDGVSITHGSSPRKHIWSFPGGATQVRTDRFGCTCNSMNLQSPPPFIGNNWYCESATDTLASGVFNPGDVLWDGQQCTGSEGPCCTNSNLPWFNTTLPQNTNEDIELRLCFDEGDTTEGTPLEWIELYIR